VNCLKKLLVIGIIVLFVGLAFIPSFNALYITERETLLKKGCYIEITKIVPYLITAGHNIQILCFTVEITNTGDESTNGDIIGFSAKAYRSGMVVFAYDGKHNTVLNPGESYLNINGSDGLQFLRILFPTIFKLEFYSFPSNDFAMGVYFIWGGFILAPSFVKLFTTVPSIIPSNIC
jgi:hypothetical protein